jgi:tetratricopeptide (TPR) repeat protein
MSDETRPRWEVVAIDDLDAIPVAEGLVWRPVRRRLGVRAFGINAYTTEGVGGHVVEEHDELSPSGAGGHEEVYVVVRGRARFTVDGETVDAPVGPIVFIRDPALKRVAIAEEADTAVLAVGGEPGSAYRISPWEWNFVAMPLLKSRRWQEAIAELEDGLAKNPGNASILYNLACAEAQVGRPLDALTHLREAVHRDPRDLETARHDPDFDPIRREQGFP